MIKTKWDKSEDEWLIANYATCGTEKSASHLGKSYNAVKFRAKKLGLKAVKFFDARWKQEEIQVLTDNYPKIGPEQTALLLRRSKATVMQKAFSLGIRYRNDISHIIVEEGCKVCSKCLKSKKFSEFTKNQKSEDGVRWQCKECDSFHGKIYRDKNLNKVALSIYNKEYHRNNRNEILAKQKIYYQENKERLKAYSKWYIRENREKCNTKQNERRRNNLHFRIKGNLSSRIKYLLNKAKVTKKNRTLELIGCSLDEFKAYIESQFEIGMCWSNYGKKGFNIDHIIPCSMFDLTKEDEQKKCFHFSNLMPRWATTEIALSYGSNQIGNCEKSDYLVDSSYYKFLENGS